MIKLKDKDGNPIIGQRTSEVPVVHDIEVAGQETTERRNYHFDVTGLALSATHLDGVNKLIADLFIEGKLDPLNVSDGSHTFKQLYTQIEELREANIRAERRVDQLLKLNSNE